METNRNGPPVGIAPASPSITPKAATSCKKEVLPLCLFPIFPACWPGPTFSLLPPRYLSSSQVNHLPRVVSRGKWWKMRELERQTWGMVVNGLGPRTQVTLAEECLSPLRPQCVPLLHMHALNREVPTRRLISLLYDQYLSPGLTVGLWKRHLSKVSSISNFIAIGKASTTSHLC